MGRIRTDDHLTDFFDWLIVAEGKNPSTAKAYTSHARKVYNAIGKAFISDREVVTGYFHEVWRSRNPNYSTIKRSWELFTVWENEITGTDVARPDQVAVSRGQVVSAPSLPPEVRRALRELKAESTIAVKDIARLQWKDVHLAQLNEPQIHLRNPWERFEWIVSSGPIRVLYEFAKPGGDLSVPLLPRVPSSNQPYPYRAILHEMHQYTEEEVQSMIRGDELMREERGSALQVDVKDAEQQPELPSTPRDLPAGVTVAPAWWGELTGGKGSA